MCDVEGQLNECTKLFRNTLKFHQTLFIIDNCSAEGEINKLSELAFSGLHRNHSLWVLTQKYNSICNDAMGQLKWNCLFFTIDRDSFEDCLKENHVVPDKNERDRLKKCLQDTIVARDTDPSLYNAGEDTDPSLYNACKVKEWANKWVERGVISEEQVNWICNDQPKPAVIYANIKTHYDHWPIRQLISANSTATENLANWIEIQLKPLVTKHESYIKDTKSFLAHIEELNKDYAPSQKALD